MNSEGYRWDENTLEIIYKPCLLQLNTVCLIFNSHWSISNKCYYRHSITLKLQVYYRGSCIVFIQSLIGTIVSWFIFIVVALIGNVAMERDVIDTGRCCWSFTLQKSTCKLMYKLIMLPMHTHNYTEHTHKPATSIPQKRADISPVMVAKMIQAMVQYDTLGWPVRG